MTKNCEYCGRKFVSAHPRKRFCDAACKTHAYRRRNPNTGTGHPARAVKSYWLTAKGYRAIGKKPPRSVVETDRELGILG